eukprot:jgi/Tetstr1/463362/TSEL_008285.t1
MSPGGDSMAGSYLDRLLVPDGAECPICHEVMSVAEESFLATCYHRFCFHCILAWTETQAAHPPADPGESAFACPLCKRGYSCVLHDVMDSGCYRRHWVPGATAAAPPADFELSAAHRRRRAAYSSPRAPPLTSTGAKLPPRVWRAEAEAWLRRELQALTMQEDVDLLLTHLVAAHLEEPEQKLDARRGKRRREDSVAVAPRTSDSAWQAGVAASAARFVFEHAERMAYELAAFCDAQLGVAAYDRARNPQAPAQECCDDEDGNLIDGDSSPGGSPV